MMRSELAIGRRGAAVCAAVKALGMLMLAFGLCVAGAVQALAQAPAASARAASAAPLVSGELVVATRILPPFVLREGDRYDGFSVELWQEIAKELALSWRWQPNGNVRELLSAVQEGRAQLGISAVSITRERAERFEFSQPMFESGLQILVPRQSEAPSGWRRFFDFMASEAMAMVLGMLALLVLVPGHVAWVLERRHPESGISPRYVPGIFQAMAWALGAFVGQQANHLQTILGRAMSLFAVFASVIFLTYVQATLTTAMTVEQLRGGIQGPDDLPGKRVGTTTGSTAASWLRQNRVQPTEFQAIAEAYAALERGQLDAVVFDAPVLQHHAAHAGSGRTEVVGPVFRKENYGIVFPPGSALRQPVNTALLKLREDGRYEALQQKWFGAR